MRSKSALICRAVEGRKWLLVAGNLGVWPPWHRRRLIPNLFPFLDPTGLISTFNTAGPND